MDDKKISLLGIWIWLIAAIFFTYEFFLRTFVGSVASEIIPDLHLNAADFALLGSAYYIVYAVMQVPVGIITDKIGVKFAMVGATLACGLATFYFAHVHHLAGAFIARGLMGFGSSFAFICLLMIVLTWFPKRFFAMFAGISQFVGTMGPLLGGGPLIALMQQTHETWREALTNIAYVGAVLAILSFIFVKAKVKDRDKLIYITQSKPVLEQLSMLFSNRQAWFIAAYSALIYVSIALLGAIWGTRYLQARGLNQLHAADVISIAWLGYAIGCPLLGGVSDLMKNRKLMMAVCALIGVVTTAIIVFLPLHVTWLYMILFFGLGIAASGQNLGFAIMSEHVGESMRATAMGLNNGMIIIFAAILPPIVSYFIDSIAANPNQLTAQDFMWPLAVMPVLYLLGLILLIFGIKETFCKEQANIIFVKTS